MTPTDPYWQLPDPELRPEFYEDVPTKRLIAWVIDTGIILTLSLLLLPFTAFTALFFFPLFYLTIGFLYRVLTISSRSATWGMRIMALEFRLRGGGRFDFGAAFLHTLGYTLSISMVLVQLGSIALMLTSARRQGLTDMVMGSVALNRAADT